MRVHLNRIVGNKMKCQTLMEKVPNIAFRMNFSGSLKTYTFSSHNPIWSQFLLFMFLAFHQNDAFSLDLLFRFYHICANIHIVMINKCFFKHIIEFVTLTTPLLRNTHHLPSWFKFHTALMYVNLIIKVGPFYLLFLCVKMLKQLFLTLLSAWLLSLLCHPEDGGSSLLRHALNYHQTTWCLMCIYTVLLFTYITNFNKRRKQKFIKHLLKM